MHNPKYRDWSCTMTIGSTSALDMALRMFTQRDDFVLAEEYTFSAAVETAAPMGVRMVGVAMDKEGLLAESLDDILTNWDEKARGGKKPFLLYTVPTGQNPTGATQSGQRRRDVYKVAQKHDLYILEDEPYYFLQMEPYAGADGPSAQPPKTREDFVNALVPSYLSLDTDGRVMRMDSFSKVVAPGSRIGWVTASQQVVDRYTKHADVSTQGPSGMSQLVLFKLLDEQWGHEGYLDWLMHIRMEYTRRRNSMLAACERHLPREVVSWKPPMAGMFVSLCLVLSCLVLSFPALSCLVLSCLVLPCLAFFPPYIFARFLLQSANHPPLAYSTGSSSTSPSTRTTRKSPSRTLKTPSSRRPLPRARSP